MAQDICGHTAKRLCSNAAQTTSECDLSDRIVKVSSIHLGCTHICTWSCPLEIGSLRMHLNTVCILILCSPNLGLDEPDDVIVMSLFSKY